jgi:hypothetical protein
MSETDNPSKNRVDCATYLLLGTISIRVLQLNMRILGFDIGAAFCAGYLLDSDHEKPEPAYPDWYRKHGRANTYKLKSRGGKGGGDKAYSLKDAIGLLEALEPDVIVMEPTGVWYSALWAKIAEHLKIEIKWIGHADLAGNRSHYGFRDKDDNTDAFCLALSAIDPAFTAKRWINARVQLAADLHRAVLEYKGLEPANNVITNQLRQRLHLEFPEIAGRELTNYRCKEGYTPWIGWLAGLRSYTRIENEYKVSIARVLKVEISQHTKDHALALATLEQRETAILLKIAELLKSPELDRYRPILEKYGFGSVTQATLLACIYPFEKFLLDGHRNMERWEDDHGKTQKRDRSRGSFQLSIGMGKRLIESGKSSKLRFAGSGLCRKMLYLWTHSFVLCRPMADKWLVIELDRRARLEHHPNQRQQPSKTVQELNREWKTTKGGNKEKHKASVRASITLAHRISRILYEDLIAEFEEK